MIIRAVLDRRWNSIKWVRIEGQKELATFGFLLLLAMKNSGSVYCSRFQFLLC